MKITYRWGVQDHKTGEIALGDECDGYPDRGQTIDEWGFAPNYYAAAHPNEIFRLVDGVPTEVLVAYDANLRFVQLGEEV